MRLTYTSPGARPGNRFAGICSHAAPSFLVTHTLPSSVPAARKPGFTYDSASATTVPYVSAPVASTVMPPVVFVLTSIFFMSCLDRSGETENMLSPRWVDLKTWLPPTYTTSLLCGDRKNGVSQLNRVIELRESCFWCARRSAM